MKFLNIISLSAILILVGCDSLINKEDYNYDDELINQIQTKSSSIIEYIDENLVDDK